MSTTIGFGSISRDHGGLSNLIFPIAKQYHYGLTSGSANAEPEVKTGLQNLESIECWNEVILLRTPAENSECFAFNIHEELIALEVHGARPNFFDFLREVEAMDLSSFSKLAIFFAGTWYSGDRIRFCYGDGERLTRILSLPGNWCFRYKDPGSGNIQDSDEVPFLFDFDL